MYFSCIYTSDLIIWLLEIFHVHSSCISNMKKPLKPISNQTVSSKYIVEPENIKSNENDILNWLSIVQNVTP